ncbi:TBPIP-domain-containing protein [Cylindrobasidium torrendii FP15055 ss-10]|uniref:TBPIP-domain-containing protein n=1 Tax=Cylindrobasidium torrendii FP15055 ss-10 TaxID=1314674 RepID=A0A0D7BLN8_9AGAR|nr:TBPIP-domain-containing protein [Cylindrobasidium torrendii FP15055 ss-10]
MNRPYGAVDVAANLKGAVPKTATQRVLVSLAEKGELTMKTYGMFSHLPRCKLDTVPAEQITQLEEEYKQTNEENKSLGTDVRVATSELAKLKNTPADDELSTQIAEVTAAVEERCKALKPLRGASSLISAEDLANVDADWVRWRAEWVRRRNIFKSLWGFATDSLPPQEVTELADDLGIEQDSGEHATLEKSVICQPTSMKRKR